jgi:hypothetical protein
VRRKSGGSGVQGGGGGKGAGRLKYPPFGSVDRWM